MSPCLPFFSPTAGSGGLTVCRGSCDLGWSLSNAPTLLVAANWSVVTDVGTGIAGLGAAGVT